MGPKQDVGGWLALAAWCIAASGWVGACTDLSTDEEPMETDGAVLAGGAGGAGASAGMNVAGSSGGGAVSGGGSGGSAGGAGSEPMSLPPTCTVEGQETCAAPGTGERMTCSGGAWIASAPCAAGELCVKNADMTASCASPNQACAGNAGKRVCIEDALIGCDASAQEMAREVCASARHCQAGIESGKCPACLPDEHRCQQAVLERCAADGQSWELVTTCEREDLCKADARACTEHACLPNTFTCNENQLRRCNAAQTAFEDAELCNAGLCDAAGGQCDKCVPSAARCDGNMAATCDPTGQTETTETCASVCAGAGKCVACVTPQHCTAQLPECMQPTCGTDNLCGMVPRGFGTPCSMGVCDGLGRCFCQNHNQCPSGQVCLSGTCSASSCGDGVMSGSEQCDDANTVTTDGCVACKTATCGDSFTRTGVEQCDDGNTADTDACVGCQSAFCGDSRTRSGVEQCDDGNTSDGDACVNCATAYCGDSARRIGVEQCDDGNTSSTDGCVACKTAFCGDNHTQTGVEQCDDGNTSSSDGCVGCKTAFCGDGAIRAGMEECERGTFPWVGNLCRNDCGRSYYRKCTNDSVCDSSERCRPEGGFCSFQGVQPDGTPDPALCNQVPGYTRGSVFGICALECAGAAKTCPAGLMCWTQAGSLWLNKCVGKTPSEL